MPLAPRRGDPAAPPAPGTPQPPPIPTTVGQFFNLVKADKTELSLKPGASDKVVISNGTPGVVGLEIVQQIPGVAGCLTRLHDICPRFEVLTRDRYEEILAPLHESTCRDPHVENWQDYISQSSDLG